MGNKKLLQPFSKKKIAALLKKRDFENFELIKIIEDFFLKKRGFVFKMPLPGMPVILLLSGGIDSIILWALLMKKYKLVVYPLVLLREKPWFLSAAVASIRFYSKIYRHRFPRQFQPAQFFPHILAQQQIIRRIPSPTAVSADFLLEHLHGDEMMLSEASGIVAYYAFAAHQYSQLLLATKNLRITTFFTAVTPSDGEVVKAQTLTSVRMAMLDLCVNAQNYSLQFTSFPLEKNLGMFHSKTEFMRWAMKNRIPLQKTHSCTGSTFLHCGRCVGCISRKEMFEKAGILDHTWYQNLFSEKISGFIHYHLTTP